MKKDKEWLKQQVKTRGIIMDKGYIYTEDVMKLVYQLEEPEITENTFWEYMSEQYRFDKNTFFRKLKENNYLKKHSIVELPVIPQFVADWLNKRKEDFKTPYEAMLYINHCGWDDDTHIEYKLFKWIPDNAETFFKVWNGDYTIEPPKTLQVIVKNYDSTVFTTELPEDEAMKLIEGWSK